MGPKAGKGPKAGPQPDADKTKRTTTASVENAPRKKSDAEKIEAARKKKEAGEKAAKEKSRKARETLKANLGLGGDFGLMVKKLLEAFGNMLSKFDGISDKVKTLFYTYKKEDADKILKQDKHSPKEIADANKKSTDITEDAKKKDKLVDFLYTALKLPIKDEGLPKGVKRSPRTLLLRMMRSYNAINGPKKITDAIKAKPPQLYKGDIVFFFNKLTGEFTAGFIKELKGKKVVVETMSPNGTYQPNKEYYTAQCFKAFHIPGNKPKGPIKIAKKKKTPKFAW